MNNRWTETGNRQSTIYIQTTKTAAVDETEHRSIKLTLLASGSRQVCELLESETAFGDTMIGNRAPDARLARREAALGKHRSPETWEEDKAARPWPDDLPRARVTGATGPPLAGRFWEGGAVATYVEATVAAAIAIAIATTRSAPPEESVRSASVRSQEPVEEEAVFKIAPDLTGDSSSGPASYKITRKTGLGTLGLGAVK